MFWKGLGGAIIVFGLMFLMIDSTQYMSQGYWKPKLVYEAMAEVGYGGLLPAKKPGEEKTFSQIFLTLPVWQVLIGTGVLVMGIGFRK